MPLARRTRAFACALACAAFALAVATSSPAATSTTVVSMTVPSATYLSSNPADTPTAGNCLGAVAGRTSFGSVLPGTPATTTADCSIVYGSTNDTATLRAYQADGFGTAMVSAPDPAWNTTGTTFTSFSNNDEFAYVTRLDASSNIVVAGTAFNGTINTIALERRLPTGAVDTNFGCASPPCSGRTTFSPGGLAATGRAMRIQSDGKIVVAGTITNATDDFLVARFNSNGTVDTTFGCASPPCTGYNSVGIGTGSDTGYDVLIDGSNRIVVGGEGRSGTRDFGIARFNSNGTIDTNFGCATPPCSGTRQTAIGTGTDTAYTVAMQSDGKYLLVGYSNVAGGSDGEVVRYATNGTVDTGYATSGVATININSLDLLRGAVMQAGNSLVVNGHTYNGTYYEALVVRLTSTGTLDTAGFNAPNGYRQIPVTSLGVAANEAIAGPGTDVYVGGYTVTSGFERDVYAIRIDSTGALVSSWGTGGVVVNSARANDQELFGGMASQSDGKLVVSSSSVSSTTGSDFAITRFPVTPSSVADYSNAALPGDTDWSGGSNMFAICLRSLVGANTAATWAVDTGNDCAATDADQWQAVPRDSAVAAAKVATTSAAGAIGTANLRFGVRTSSGQAPGSYQAPVAFEVIAPSV